MSPSLRQWTLSLYIASQEEHGSSASAHRAALGVLALSRAVPVSQPGPQTRILTTKSFLEAPSWRQGGGGDSVGAGRFYTEVNFVLVTAREVLSLVRLSGKRRVTSCTCSWLRANRPHTPMETHQGGETGGSESPSSPVCMLPPGLKLGPLAGY